MTVSALQEGFQIPSLRLAVVTESNLLPRRRKRGGWHSRRPGCAVRTGREIWFAQQHGIGRYMGLKLLKLTGSAGLPPGQAGAQTLYSRGTDRSYSEIYRVGREGPRLHSLAAEWHQVKSRAKESVHQMAQGAAGSHAYRAMTPGYSYGPIIPGSNLGQAFPTRDSRPAAGHCRSKARLGE